MAKSKTGINKLFGTSDELFDFMGKEEVSRAQVTKAIWDYVKKHDLQDEDDKRIIIPDEELAPILGKKPVHMMKLQGLLSKHLFDLED